MWRRGGATWTLVLAVAVAVTLTPHAHADSGDDSPLDRLRRDKRACLDGRFVKPCVMFTNDEEAFGCAQCGDDVRQDAVREFGNIDALLGFLSPENDRRVIMIPAFIFFETEVLTKLKDARNVAAVLVFPGDAARESPLPFPPLNAQSLSTDIADPNQRYNYYSKVTAIPARNAVGKGNKFSLFPFNIFYINETAASTIRDLNERFPSPEDTVALTTQAADPKKATSTSPRYKVQSRGQMWACPSDAAPPPNPDQQQQPDDDAEGGGVTFSMTSKQCLDDRACLPIGGQSLWSALEWIDAAQPSAERNILAISAPIDSIAFFPDFALGASAEIASLAVLMAVAEAVGNYRRGPGREREMLWQPVYFAWNAQAWGYAGSSRFLKDLRTFECKKMNDPTQFQHGCEAPFMDSLKFLDLRAATFSVLNIGQMTVPLTAEQAASDEPDKYYMQGGKSSQNDSTPLELVLTRQFNERSDDNLQLEDGRRDLIPIDASQSFERFLPQFDRITIANYNEAFDNNYYHSMFDDVRLIGDSQLDKLKRVADAIARSVIEYAFGDAESAPDTSRDVIQQVLICMTQNWTSCDLANEYMGEGIFEENEDKVAEGNYPGSFFPATRLSDTNPSGAAKLGFISSFLAYHNRYDVGEEPECESFADCSDFIEALNERQAPTSHSELRVGFCARGTCVASDTYTHNAYGSALRATNDAQSSFEYNASGSRQTDAADPTPAMEAGWTESVWDKDLGVCGFVEDTPLFGGLILGAGVAVLLVSMVLTFWFDRLMFKALPEADANPSWVPGAEPSV